MALEDHGFTTEEQMTAAVKPLAEHAGIMRRQLIKQGWSRSCAEQLTRELILAGLTNTTTENILQSFTKRPK